MGREPFFIVNPKGNNRDIVVETIGQSGKVIRLAYLKPGERFAVEKDKVWARTVHRPVTMDFIFQDGKFTQQVQDSPAA